VGDVVGQRSWTVGAWGLVKTVRVSVRLVGLCTSLQKELRVMPAGWLVASILVSSAMLSSSSSGVWSSKMANRLLLSVCCWLIGHERRMFDGAVESCEVVGVWDG
jgi:hypothetical protein